jgi:hypothetical protein
MFVVFVFVPLVLTIVAITLPIPFMVMFDPAVASFPVASEVLSAFVTRPDPRRTGIRSPRPITLMPPVVAALGIPITVDPNVTRPRALRYNPNYAWRWGRADSNENLRAK